MPNYIVTLPGLHIEELSMVITIGKIRWIKFPVSYHHDYGGKAKQSYNILCDGVFKQFFHNVIFVMYIVFTSVCYAEESLNICLLSYIINWYLTVNHIFNFRIVIISIMINKVKL